MNSTSNQTPFRQDPWSTTLQRQPWLWLGIVILYFALDQGRQGLPEYSVLMVRSVVWGLCGCGLSSALCVLYWRVGLHKRRLFLTVPLVLLCNIIISFVWLAVFNGIDGIFHIEEGHVPIELWEREQLFGEWMDYCLISFVWHGALGVQIQAALASLARERTLRAERLAEQARVAMLRYQIEPHFFFNSLNSAIALIDEEPAAAQDMLTQLCVMFRARFSLGFDENSTVAQELEMLRRYVSIEKVRFEDKLQVSEEIEPESLAFNLPPFLLQPLIENAIKHGMRSSVMPLRVEIITKMAPTGELCLSIKNTGRLGEGRGLGTHNVRERLVAELPNRHIFTLEQLGEWVCATLTVAALGKEISP